MTLDAAVLSNSRQAGIGLGTVPRSYSADRCACVLAAAVGCGVMVSIGDGIATDGPSPVTGWGIELSGAMIMPPTAVVLDGGCLSTASTVRGTNSCDSIEL